MEQTPARRVFDLVFAAIILAACLAKPASAIPTMLNSVTSTGIQAENTFLLEMNRYRFNYEKTSVPTDSSMVYGLKYGFRNVEVGCDIVGNKDFENAGLFASSGHLKWRILDDSTSSSPISLAVGSLFLGAKKLPGLESVAYKPAPYIVAGRSIGDWRLTLGYQKNLFGFTKADVDPATGDFVCPNEGIMLGIDGTIIHSKKNPVTLMIDYTGGPMAVYGLGLCGPINERLSWCFTYFHPQFDTLPSSGGELATQYWYGISYTIPVAR